METVSFSKTFSQNSGSSWNFFSSYFNINNCIAVCDKKKRYKDFLFDSRNIKPDYPAQFKLLGFMGGFRNRNGYNPDIWINAPG